MTAQLNMQALEALTKANEVRFARADDKRRIRRGALTASEVLRVNEPYWASAPIAELLLTIPRVGRQQAQKWCKLEWTPLDTRIGQMTPRQRAVMARQIDVWAFRRDDLTKEAA